MLRSFRFAFCFLAVSIFFSAVLSAQKLEPSNNLSWNSLPDLPDSLGVAGPFVGVHQDALIVAGGANFPEPVWENGKRWHDDIFVLPSKAKGTQWLKAGKLPNAVAYGCSVSTEKGLLCIGGNDSAQVFDKVFLLSWDRSTKQITQTPYPSLPEPCVHAAAVISGNKVYVFCGQSGLSLSSATQQVWTLDLSKESDKEKFVWEQLPDFPGKSRAFLIAVYGHDGFDDSIYLISGRREKERKDAENQKETEIEFLTDLWQYNLRTKTWKQKASVPSCVMAGTAVGAGQSHLLVLSGADGTLFYKGTQLKDKHPGFPKRTWLYHTITDRWTPSNPSPINPVTTKAVKWGEEFVLVSGELRPRVRTAKAWLISLTARPYDFGTLNYTVVVLYLIGIVGIGFYFAGNNRSTNDFFRGGKRIPWWAAGCSIFATMLSSLTFTGIPAKSYAQDWVYSIGNFTIPLVAIVAVYLAMPFYRRIDATSAYEYLEKRFHPLIRLLGSSLFLFFHLFRMAIIMSLTAMALAVATPLTPFQAVILMGMLSVLYCSVGGIEAVIWTDTVQTVVLLGGAIVAFGMLVGGTQGGFEGFWDSATEGEKLRIANWHTDVFSSQIAFWVVVVGSIAQNTSSYTADQAVVQRYLTTKDSRLAARSIWTNAVLTIPATLLFFGLGTALFAFYQSHPEKLDPTITTEQIFPFFIANELPAGVAGLIVAGIFAAAQSTISTSMNSTSTTFVTDIVKRFGVAKSEQTLLWVARVATAIFGLAGTSLALVFIDPEIKSLFDEFIKVVGLFMGVLGGLFLLGACSRRANAFGAMVGTIAGFVVMVLVWRASGINGYLFTAIGMSTCISVGWVASFLTPIDSRSLQNLTIYTFDKS